jgi:hypothetical protein
LQLSNDAFAEYGGRGSIFDPDENLAAGALKLKALADQFRGKYGREPSASELYLMHQQGPGGSAAHWANPDAPAWQNMLSTAEGRQKGPAWAKQAIWGNVPDDVKARYGSVDNLTSRDFVKLWNDKVARYGGGASPEASAPTAVASAGPPVSAPVAAPAASSPAPATGSGSKPLLPMLAGMFGMELPDSLSAPAPEGGGLLGGSLNIGPFSIGGVTDDNMKLAQAALSNAAGETASTLEKQGMSPTQSINLGRLLAVLQNRSRLGTV